MQIAYEQIDQLKEMHVITLEDRVSLIKVLLAAGQQQRAVQFVRSVARGERRHDDQRRPRGGGRQETPAELLLPLVSLFEEGKVRAQVFQVFVDAGSYSRGCATQELHDAILQGLSALEPSEVAASSLKTLVIGDAERLAISGKQLSLVVRGALQTNAEVGTLAQIAAILTNEAHVGEVGTIPAGQLLVILDRVSRVSVPPVAPAWPGPAGSRFLFP